MRTLEIRGQCVALRVQHHSFRKIAGLTLKLCSGCIALDQQRESTKESQDS
jgi:hypothetical protein